MSGFKELEPTLDDRARADKDARVARAALLAEGKRLEALGDYENALTLYYEVLAKRPKDTLLRRKMAWLCFLAGKTKEGVSHFVALARIYEEDGFYVYAVDCLKKARRLDPEDLALRVHQLSLYLTLHIKMPEVFWNHCHPTESLPNNSEL